MSDLVWAGIGQGTVLVTPMHMCDDHRVHRQRRHAAPKPKLIRPQSRSATGAVVRDGSGLSGTHR